MSVNIALPIYGIHSDPKERADWLQESKPVKKKSAPKSSTKSAKSPAARMGMTEAEHRAMQKGGKAMMKPMKMPKRGGY